MATAQSVLSKTGGPAFPPAPADGATEAEKANFPGVTVRDYIAVRAPEPPSWWEMDAGEPMSLERLVRRRARWNYAYADAMMLARKGQPA